MSPSCTSPAPALVALVALATVSGCRAPATEGPVPVPVPSVSAGVVARRADQPERARNGYTLADVRFMQRMIAHHTQALRMTDLVPDRTARPDMRLLAERITVSQRDEIARMQRWLRERDEEVPTTDQHGSHVGTSEAAAGMLTPDEMTRLAAAKGTEFEREFLRLMIKHHEGALAMVAALFSTHGAGQDTQIYFFASDVEADQRAEVSRMQSMLAAMSSQ